MDQIHLKVIYISQRNITYFWEFGIFGQDPNINFWTIEVKLSWWETRPWSFLKLFLRKYATCVEFYICSYLYQENIMNCHLKRNYEFSIVEWSTVVSIINKIASKIHKKQFWFGLKEMYRHCCTHSKKRLFHSQWMLTKNGNLYKLFPTHRMPHIVWNHLLMFEQKCKTNVVWTSEQHLNPVALRNLENLDYATNIFVFWRHGKH